MEVKIKAGTLLKDYRERHSITQQELAKRLGLSQSTLSAIENGDSIPRILTARRIAKVINVTVPEMFAEQSPEAVHA